jgi:hypothetical protein
MHGAQMTTEVLPPTRVPPLAPSTMAGRDGVDLSDYIALAVTVPVGMGGPTGGRLLDCNGRSSKARAQHAMLRAWSATVEAAHKSLRMYFEPKKPEKKGGKKRRAGAGDGDGDGDGDAVPEVPTVPEGVSLEQLIVMEPLTNGRRDPVDIAESGMFETYGEFVEAVKAVCHHTPIEGTRYIAFMPHAAVRVCGTYNEIWSRLCRPDVPESSRRMPAEPLELRVDMTAFEWMLVAANYTSSAIPYLPESSDYMRLTNPANPFCIQNVLSLETATSVGVVPRSAHEQFSDISQYVVRGESMFAEGGGAGVWTPQRNFTFRMSPALVSVRMGWMQQMTVCNDMFQQVLPTIAERSAHMSKRHCGTQGSDGGTEQARGFGFEIMQMMQDVDIVRRSGNQVVLEDVFWALRRKNATYFEALGETGDMDERLIIWNNMYGMVARDWEDTWMNMDGLPINRNLPLMAQWWAHRGAAALREWSHRIEAPRAGSTLAGLLEWILIGINEDFDIATGHDVFLLMMLGRHDCHRRHEYGGQDSLHFSMVMGGERSTGKSWKLDTLAEMCVAGSFFISDHKSQLCGTEREYKGDGVEIIQEWDNTAWKNGSSSVGGGVTPAPSAALRLNKARMSSGWIGAGRMVKTPDGRWVDDNWTTWCGTALLAATNEAFEGAEDAILSRVYLVNTNFTADEASVVRDRVTRARASENDARRSSLLEFWRAVGVQVARIETLIFVGGMATPSVECTRALLQTVMRSVETDTGFASSSNMRPIERACVWARQLVIVYALYRWMFHVDAPRVDLDLASADDVQAFSALLVDDEDIAAFVVSQFAADLVPWNRIRLMQLLRRVVPHEASRCGTWYDHNGGTDDSPLDYVTLTLGMRDLAKALVNAQRTWESNRMTLESILAECEKFTTTPVLSPWYTGTNCMTDCVVNKKKDPVSRAVLHADTSGAQKLLRVNWSAVMACNQLAPTDAVPNRHPLMTYIERALAHTHAEARTVVVGSGHVFDDESYTHRYTFHALNIPRGSCAGADTPSVRAQHARFVLLGLDGPPPVPVPGCGYPSARADFVEPMSP